MRNWAPWKIILLGFIMVTLGLVFPLLMVLQVVKSSFFLNFLSVLLSVGGVLVGFIGMSFFVKVQRKKD